MNTFNRRLRNTLLIGTVLAACVSGRRAQASPSFQASDDTSKVDLPDGDGAWVLQVTTRGGFAGGGTGDLLITSEGKLSCSRKEMKCADRLTAGTASRLGQIIAALRASDWSDPGLGGSCFDCVATTMSLTVRDGAGSIQAFAVRWDVSTEKHLTPELQRLYRATIGLAR